MEAFMPEDGTSDRASTSWDIVSLDEAVETDDGSRKEGGTHLKYGMSSSLPLDDANDRLRIWLIDHLLQDLLR